MVEIPENCRGCGVANGELHEMFCTLERCPFCGGQLAACACIHEVLDLSVEESACVDEYVDDSVEPLKGIVKRWVVAIEEKRRIPYGEESLESQLEELTESIRVAPDRAALYMERGRMYYALDLYTDAVSDFSEAIELCPDDCEAWHYRGSSYWHLQESVLAEADLTRAIDLSDGDEEWLDATFLYRGGLRCNDRRPEDALDDLNRSLELDPDSVWAYAFRGNAYWRMKNFRKAIADYETAMEIEPDDDYTVGTLAWFLATCEEDSIRDGKRAFKLATRAVAETDGDEHLESLAAALAELGNYAAAVTTVQTAIEQCDDPNELDALKEQLATYKTEQPYRDFEGG